MECPHCHKTFKSKVGFKHHTDEKVCMKYHKMCVYCGKYFADKRNLFYHIEHNVCQGRTTISGPSETYFHDDVPENSKKRIRLKQRLPDNITQSNRIPTQPPARIKQSIWIQYIGSSVEGKCYCCGINEITAFNFEIGHVLAKSKGGLMTIENLRPICNSCNRSMYNRNMKDFVSMFYPNSPLMKENELKT